MLSDESSNFKAGLSQFKEDVKEPEVKVTRVQKDVSLSDLMRRSA